VTNIVALLVSVCYPNGRKLLERKCVAHFDNAPIHSAKVVTEKLEEGNLKRMPHPSYRPDISPGKLFPFGSLKDILIDKRYPTPDELSCEVETIISETPSGLISRVFQTWQERLQKSYDTRGHSIEEMLHFARFQVSYDKGQVEISTQYQAPSVFPETFQASLTK
jgi:hypothetical protein